jgi:hypothetical protein
MKRIMGILLVGFALAPVLSIAGGPYGQLQKGSVITDNDIGLIRDGILEQPYRFQLASRLHDPRLPQTKMTYMVLLTRKLGEERCNKHGTEATCNKLQVVDIAKVHNYPMLDEIALPISGISCTWKGKSLLTVLSNSKDKSKSLVAGWAFNLKDEQIVSVPPNEIDCHDYFQEVARKKKAYEFLINGWAGDVTPPAPIKDIKYFYKLGKVVAEDAHKIKQDDRPSQDDEIHNFKYNGMSISVYRARFDGKEQVSVNDVAITNARWPVMFGLTVGTHRKVVEETLGRSQQLTNDLRQWSYADASMIMTFSFDGNDKVKSITWHDDGSAN